LNLFRAFVLKTGDLLEKKTPTSCSINLVICRYYSFTYREMLGWLYTQSTVYQSQMVLCKSSYIVTMMNWNVVVVFIILWLILFFVSTDLAQLCQVNVLNCLLNCSDFPVRNKNTMQFSMTVLVL
jgi:hypothetical protein